MKPMSERVVVTGMNMISSLGLNLDESWKNMVQGKSGVGKITLFDPSGLDTRIAAELPAGFDDYSAEFIRKRLSKQMSRATRMALACTMPATQQANIQFDNINPSRIAVILSAINAKDYTDPDKEKNRILKGMTNAVSAWISLEYKITGPNYTIATACASSSYAIAQGYDLIKSGNADLVIAGGADSIIHYDEIKGFNDLYALSTKNDHPEKASAPFSLHRDGFVIGEGAGIVILESASSAKKRGAKILAEMLGHGLLSEAYNIMAPQPEGVGMAKTMEKALEHAGITKNEVDYINAHGTSTTQNDLFETLAIKKVFGNKAYQIPVSSTKSMVGHTIGAAGGIESVTTIKALQENTLPPTINLDSPDPELDLNYVPHTAKKHNINIAISNSFAFGGHNACLVYKKLAP